MLSELPANRTRRRSSLARSAILFGAAFLLISMGGAIVVAPLSLPLLAWTARGTPSPALRVLAIALAALTAAEVGWALAYVTMGEAQPWIVAVPVVAAFLVAGFLVAAALSRR